MVTAFTIIVLLFAANYESVNVNEQKKSWKTGEKSTQKKAYYQNIKVNIELW